MPAADHRLRASNLMKQAVSYSGQNQTKLVAQKKVFPLLAGHALAACDCRGMPIP